MFFLVACKKEKQIERKLRGTWEVNEIQNDSTTLYNLNEKFTFFKCVDRSKRSDIECDGIFITSNGNEENFKWGIIKEDIFCVEVKDTNLSVYKYGNCVTIKEYSKSKFVLVSSNYGTMTLIK